MILFLIRGLYRTKKYTVELLQTSRWHMPQSEWGFYRRVENGLRETGRGMENANLATFSALQCLGR